MFCTAKNPCLTTPPKNGRVGIVDDRPGELLPHQRISNEGKTGPAPFGVAFIHPTGEN